MRVDQIWTYPVKSMLGTRVPSAVLGEEGIVGDRRWTLRDERRGAIASARRVAAISRLGAAFEPEGTGVLISLPDGSEVSSGDADVDARLSAAVGHPVTLWRRDRNTNRGFWARGRPDSDDFMTELRSIFGREGDEPLPDLSIFPAEMVDFEYPPGTFYDCFPLLIMTTSALRSLRAALPNSAVDERRFRPSIVVDTGDAVGHPEFDWTGRRLVIGSVELQIGAACPRCVTVTREFSDDLPGDRRVLRHIVRDLNQNTGVYASVVAGGVARLGDPVTVH